MEIYTPPGQAEVIPIIDISGPEDEVAAAIGEACRNIGFFYVAGHTVPLDLIERQFAVAREFFAVPDEEKQRLHIGKSTSLAGYEAVCDQVLDSQDADGQAAPPDLKESFYCTTNDPVDNPDARSPVPTPSQNQWPQGLDAGRAQTLAYGEAVQALGDRIFELLAISLGLPKTWFAPFCRGGGARLRMLRYPPQKEEAEYNQIGAGAHTDWGGITMLAQDQLGGLEVRDVKGNWVAADPVAGTFVINLGDLMMRWTNGIYRSNMHRVRNNHSTCDRYSIPLFYGPRSDAVIEPIACCVTPDNPRRFDTCTAGEHVREMFTRSYGYAPTYLT